MIFLSRKKALLGSISRSKLGKRVGSDCVEGDNIDKMLFLFATIASFFGSMIGKAAKPTPNPGEMVLSVC
jgi:hypothetical protein